MVERYGVKDCCLKCELREDVDKCSFKEANKVPCETKGKHNCSKCEPMGNGRGCELFIPESQTS